jgi:hypothetical protein
MIAVAPVWDLDGRPQRIANVKRFMRDFHGCRLWVVEMAYEDKDWQLPATRDVLHVRGNRCKHSMFMKEALFNYTLPDLEHDSVVWIDADVVFMRDDWVDQARRELEHHQVCQLFGTTRYETAHHDLGTEIRSAASLWAVRDHAFDDLAKVQTGLAWAARREWLQEKGGLFDRMVGGSNDTVMWKAFTGGMARLQHLNEMSSSFRQYVMEYVHRMEDTTVGYVEGCLIHLHHGDLRTRDYAHRWKLPWYYPTTDVQVRNGLLEWSHDDAAKKFAEHAVLLRST